MKANTRSVIETLKSVSGLTLIFIISGFIYAYIDPSEMRDFGIFPWDSGEYRKIAGLLAEGGFSKLEGMYPFAPRLFFPAVYGSLANYFDVSFINSAYIVNIGSSFFVILFTYFFLSRNEISNVTAITIAAIYTVLWLGPLRYANYYPGGGFAFESAIVCALFLTLQEMNKRGIIFFIFGTITVALLAIGRELVFYLMFVAVTFAIALKLEFLSLFGNQSPVVNRKQVLVLICAFFGSLIGYLVARHLVVDTGENYSVLNTIAIFGYFHLHVGEFFYPLFYALGPFFLAFLVAVSFRTTRNELIGELRRTTKDPLYVFVFIFCGLAFAMVGGTDSDRFLLWFFPFFALIGSKSIQILWAKTGIHRKLIGVVFILTLAFWTRFYVPAIPHIFFPGDLYNSFAGVRTNLSPDLYRGPNFLEKFRFPLNQVALEDSYQSVVIDNPPVLIEQQPYVSKTLSRNHDQKAGSPYKGSYRWELNNIPLPLGFAHNQFELLVAHPYHGDPRVRLMLLLQWFSLYIVFLVLFKRNLRSG